MSKVILFGVLIFYSNFGVSVSYTDELAVEREYWPSDWSGNEHPRRQFRNDGFAQTRHENHARPVNNQEYNDQAIRSAHTNHYNNNNPAVQPVPDKQLLPNFGSSEFNREVAPQLQRETHDQTYPRYVDRFEVRPSNEPIRNQNWKSQVHHQSPLSPNHEKKSYTLPTGRDYDRQHNTHPINVEYDNQAETENISNNRHISNQARPSRPNAPIPYLNFDRSNSEATNLEEQKYIESIETSTPPNYSNYKDPVHSEVLENSRRKSNDRKHNVGRNEKHYLIPTYLEDRIENNNVAPHGYEVSEKTVPDSVTEPQNRIYIDNDEISKNIGSEPVSTHTTDNLVTANLAEKHKFITIDRSGSEYRIPVLPLNKYDNNPATKYVLGRNPQDSFVADKVPSNYHESVINNAGSSNDAVKHVNKYIPKNIADDGKDQRSEPVRSHHTSPRVVSNNLRNNHPIMRQLQNDNNERGSGIRELITGDVNNNSESNGYQENPGQWNNIPTDSHNNVQNFNNRNAEASQVIAPAQKYNNLPLPHNVRHISNDGGSFRKPNSQPIYRPEHNRHIDGFRPRLGNHDSAIFTHDNAPSLTNNVNNHENSKHNIINNNNNENNDLVTPASQYIPVNGRPIESYNNGFVNPHHRPNKPNHNIPISHQRENQAPNSRLLDNPNNAGPELGYVEKKPESIKYFANDKTKFAYPGFEPFRTFNEAFEALQGNKHTDPIYTDGFEPITPNRESTFVDTYDKSLPKHDIPYNLKSGDDETFNINGAPNVSSNTANSNVEKILPNQENYNIPGPAVLQPDSDIPRTQQIVPQTPAEELDKQKHLVLVLPDGTLEDVNKDENTQVSKNPKDILNSDVKEEKVMEKANEVQSPKQVKTLITTATPVPTETDISENNLKINEEFGIKEHQQEPPVESPPIDKTVLNSAAKRLPEDENAVVTTPYPYVTTESPLERAPDNVYDDLVITTVSPVLDSAKALENDEEGKAKDDVISSNDLSQSKELNSEPMRGNNENNNNEPPTADVVTRGDDLLNEDRRVISGIPGGKRLVSKPTPKGLKFLLDPINVSDEDTITIAIELSEAPDNVILNRNNADGYSNEALNGREDLLNTNGNQAARFRPRNNHNNKKFDDRIEPLYILPVEQLPVMEKETVVTQYPNGTIVTVITEVVYDNFEGTPPKVTRTEKIAELNG